MSAQQHGRAISHRLLAAISFLLSVIAFGAINLLWSRDFSDPQVILLGSGDRISALVTSGPSRVLIATGDDPNAFANALRQIRRPTMPRLDVLLVAGGGKDLAAPASIVTDPDLRLAMAVAPFPNSPEFPALQSVQPVSAPRRLTMPNGVSITVESEPASEPSAAQERWAWRVIVSRGASRVVLLSDGEDAGLFPPANPANVLAISGSNPLDGWQEVPAQLISFNDEALSPGELRTSVATDEDGPDWAVRVFPGEAVAFTFRDGSVEVDPSATDRLLPERELEATASPPPG
ncbi:MAG: hypothetical protein ACR2J8_11530 [Thermomicrobiales bacterium]